MLEAVDVGALRPGQVSFFIPFATDVLFSANPVQSEIDSCAFNFSAYRYDRNTLVWPLLINAQNRR